MNNYKQQFQEDFNELFAPVIIDTFMKAKFKSEL